jgi:hypothetical protein
MRLWWGGCCEMEGFKGLLCGKQGREGNCCHEREHGVRRRMGSGHAVVEEGLEEGYPAKFFSIILYTLNNLDH